MEGTQVGSRDSGAEGRLLTHEAMRAARGYGAEEGDKARGGEERKNEKTTTKGMFNRKNHICTFMCHGNPF